MRMAVFVMLMITLVLIACIGMGARIEALEMKVQRLEGKVYTLQQTNQTP